MNRIPGYLLVAGAVLAGAAPAWTKPPVADQVYISKLRFSGTGCSDADAKAKLDDEDDDGLPDRFTVLFSKYVAQQGPGVPASERRKNCNLKVTLQLPQGRQFSIAKVLYTGFADLPKGVTGTQRTDYKFVLPSNKIRLESTLYGEFIGEYQIEDTLTLASLVWSRCGRSAPLDMRTEIYLSGVSSEPAQMTTDQIDGKVTQVYGLQWRRCRDDRR
jgi:hypothetical protein